MSVIDKNKMTSPWSRCFHRAPLCGIGRRGFTLLTRRPFFIWLIALSVLIAVSAMPSLLEPAIDYLVIIPWSTLFSDLFMVAGWYGVAILAGAATLGIGAAGVFAWAYFKDCSNG